MGLHDICESVEKVNIERTLGVDQHHETSEEEENEEKSTKQVRRFFLLQRPQNSDALPPAALATRLLLECLRRATDIQNAAAQALQRCLNGKSQDEIHHVLEYWLEIYRCLMEVCISSFNFLFKLYLYGLFCV